jgi:hypothetical protein
MRVQIIETTKYIPFNTMVVGTYEESKSLGRCLNFTVVFFTNHVLRKGSTNSLHETLPDPKEHLL